MCSVRRIVQRILKRMPQREKGDRVTEDADSLAGTFWQADTPDRRVSGQLTIGSTPALETLGRIFDERAYRVEVSPRGGTTITESGDPDDLVADWEPRNIHGELDDGTPVSVVGAQGGKRRSRRLYDPQYRQRFSTIRHIILDEHVTDQETYSGCRFRLTGPNWLRHDDGEALTSDGGRLVGITEGDDHWFEFTPVHPVTISDIDRWVLHPIDTLASLVIAHPAETVDLRVRLTPESPWRKVNRGEQPVPTGSHELLDASYLSSDRCARWIDFRRRSNGLDAAAIDDLRGVAIQTAVLTLAAVAEGLHRRLYPDEKRVAALSRGDLKKAGEAARQAAITAVRDIDRSDRTPLLESDLAEFESAMKDAFNHINESTFRTRMTDLMSTAQAAVPNIVTAFAEWPKAVAEARNVLAHQGTESDIDATDQFHDSLIALSYSISWVLRTVLLVEAGFDATTLRDAYRLSSAYNHHITNARNFLRGGPYAAPSSG